LPRTGTASRGLASLTGVGALLTGTDDPEPPPELVGIELVGVEPDGIDGESADLGKSIRLGTTVSPLPRSLVSILL